MRYVFWVLLFLGAPPSSLADFGGSGRLCTSVQSLQVPPPPAPACAAFRPAHVALAAYAADAVATCARADAFSASTHEHQSRACPSGAAPSDGCAQGLLAADGNYAQVESTLQAVRARNEPAVTASFPGQGQRISGNCLAVLDAYQQFAYDISGAVREAEKSVQSARTEVKAQAATLVQARAVTAVTPPKQ